MVTDSSITDATRASRTSAGCACYTQAYARLPYLHRGYDVTVSEGPQGSPKRKLQITAHTGSSGNSFLLPAGLLLSTVAHRPHASSETRREQEVESTVAVMTEDGGVGCWLAATVVGKNDINGRPLTLLQD